MVAVLDFLTKHFLVLSTVITSLLTAIIFIFIASYLSVFDKNIIWIIEYTDIIKFIFITLGIASGLVTFVYSFVQWFILYFDIRVRKVLLYLFIFSVIAPSVWDIWSHRHEAGRVEYNIFIFSSEFVLIGTIGCIRAMIISWHNLHNKTLLLYAFMFLIAIGIFGRTYGLYVQVSGPNHNEVWVKDAQTLHDATVIMILSHHSIFLVGEAIVTIPSANVIRIVHRTQ